ncbi:kinase-like domain-containing protein [Mycena latifolia]|nr:kinase-like domain-containing protein [Mycena latifolia]
MLYLFIAVLSSTALAVAIQLGRRHREEPDLLLPLDLCSDLAESRAIWLSARDLFQRHKMIPFDVDPYWGVPGPPLAPAQAPFTPLDDEDFVHRGSKPERIADWSPRSFCHCLALDRFGRNVFLKACPRDSMEWKIVQHLSDSTPARHPWNRTIPIMNIIHTRHYVVLVQAYWGTIPFIPPCDTLVTRLHVAKQVLEGLCYMHSVGVAHGDIHEDNLVCNHEDTRKDGSPGAPFQSTFNFQLAFIDFGSAMLFPEGTSPVVPIASLRSRPPEPFGAPELCGDSDVDLFSADIFAAGQVLLVEREYWPKGSCAPSCPEYDALLENMTAADPTVRPRAPEALAQLKTVIAQAQGST